MAMEMNDLDRYDFCFYLIDEASEFMGLFSVFFFLIWTCWPVFWIIDFNIISPFCFVFHLSCQNSLSQVYLGNSACADEGYCLSVDLSV
jgi:hypothetical protein